MENEERPTEWLRGLLDVCVLGVISRGPTYGYRIATALAQAGLGDVKGGTLYPLLSRAERDGLVATHWEAGDGGPGRKFYELTNAGTSRLAQLAAAWRHFSASIDSVISIDPRNPTEES